METVCPICGMGMTPEGDSFLCWNPACGNYAKRESFRPLNRAERREAARNYRRAKQKGA